MFNSSEWVLKAILNRYPGGGGGALQKMLPEAEQARLDAMPSAGVETDVEEPPLLDRIHWSWLLPCLESYSLKEQKLFLSALPPASRQHLCRELKIKTSPHEELGKAGQEFLLQTLSEWLTGKQLELLPVYFLPPTPLSPLLHFDKQKLVRFIDALSLSDLAIELRQIVETKILKKIYSFLSDEEKKSLKKAAAAKQSAGLGRFPLDKWNGSEKSLRLLLHKRGLVRLGIALSAEHPDFTWYICHQLDIGRGTALLKLAKSEASKGNLSSITRGVEELLREFA